MYDYLEGTIATCRGTRVVLDNGGIGWRLDCSLTSTRRLAPGEAARLYVHQVVREDNLALYGFCDSLEREVFVQLISVSGIGPKVALAILSGMTVRELLGCVRFGDAEQLTRIPGIGKKTAGRLLLELGNRIQQLETPLSGDEGPAEPTLAAGGDVLREALEALTALGWKPARAEKELARARAALGEMAGVGELVRQALKQGR